MAEARRLAAHDDPAEEYLAYTMELKDNHEVIGSVGCSYYVDLEKIIATIREDNAPSWKAIEKAGFLLTEQRPYRDLGDEEELIYRFYSCRKS